MKPAHGRGGAAEWKGATMVSDRFSATKCRGGREAGEVSVRSLLLVRSSQLVAVCDEDHALALLREAGVSAADESELRDLARQVLDGRLVLVRNEEPVEFDDLSDVADAAPRLTELTLAG